MAEVTKSQTILSEEDRSHILNWLKERWPEDRHTCEVCTKTQWTIHPHLVTPTTLSGKDMQLGGFIYPVIQVMCTNCGNTKYINAMIAGVPSFQKQEMKKEVSNG